MVRPSAFQDSSLTADERAVRDTAARFAEREIAPHVDAWEEAGSFPRELYVAAARAGLLGLGMPESVGGQGGTILHAMLGSEGLLRGGSTGVVAGLGSAGIALPPILATGSPEQQERFVRPVLAGDRIAALAITEPGAGSDVSAVATRAVREGEHYRITGSKLFITSGVRADQVTVLARTGADAHGGLTFFIVERGMPGFTSSAPLRKTGWWASDTAELSFEDVVVPTSHRIGAEGSGFVTLMRTFQGERLALAAMGVATAEICFEAALAYVRERKVFGRPIVGFQVIRHRLADMATEVNAARALTYSVARRVAEGQALVAEVSMAKNFAADVAVRVSHEAVQLFGGMGYMRETLVERLSRDARLLPIGGGTSEVMREIISKAMGF